MDKYKNFIKIMMLFLFVLIILYILFKPYNKYVENIDNLEKINIYFINQSNNNLESEIKYIEKTDILEKISFVLDEFMSTVKAMNNIDYLDKSVNIKKIKLVNNTDIELTFSKEYLDIDIKDELLLRAGLVWTLTDLKEIQNIKIFIDDKPLMKANGDIIGNLNRYNVVLNPKIMKKEVNKVKVKLYFIDCYKKGLFAEEREIDVSSEQTLEEQVINQLFKGPENKELQSFLTSDIKLLDVIITDKICYVDLSSEFISKFQIDPNLQELVIYSIVNSLTALPNNRVKKVQFLISSEKVKGFSSEFSLNQPFERKENIILEK